MLAQRRPIFRGLVDDGRGLLLEYWNPLFRAEHVELAVRNRPSLRIRLLLDPARDVDCAIAGKLRGVMIGIGDEERARPVLYVTSGSFSDI